MDAYFSLLAVFTTSLLGSLHCVGMCGGFISLYSLGHDSLSSDSALKTIGGHEHLSREVAFHGLYNLGRLCAYLTLGTIAGSLGSGLNWFLPRDRAFLGTVQQGVGVVAGMLIVIWGIVALLRQAPNLNFGQSRIVAKLSNVLRRLPLRFVNFTAIITPERGPLAIGLLSGILPCGWLYTFVTMAFGSASPLAGFLIMFAFWLGTVPAMLMSGFVMMRITGKIRQFAPTATALLVILLGLFTLSGKFTPHEHHHESGISRTGFECAP